MLSTAHAWLLFHAAEGWHRVGQVTDRSSGRLTPRLTSPQGPAATWAEREAAWCALLHLQLGFPLDLYAPHEMVQLYWYSNYLLGCELHLTRLLHAGAPPPPLTPRRGGGTAGGRGRGHGGGAVVAQRTADEAATARELEVGVAGWGQPVGAGWPGGRGTPRALQHLAGTLASRTSDQGALHIVESDCEACSVQQSPAQSVPPHPHSSPPGQGMLLELERTMCQGVFHAAIALHQLGCIQVPATPFNTGKDGRCSCSFRSLFHHRMALCACYVLKAHPSPRTLQSDAA